MNVIDNLVAKIERIFINAPSDQYEIKELETGTPILLDKINKIRIVIHVQDIVISRYNKMTGELESEITISWYHLTKKQRERIAELVDVPDDLDVETQESLTQILKGV